MSQFEKTEGIVLRCVKYAEHDAIVTLFTKQFGIRSFYLNRVYAPKAKIKSALLQPFSQLEVVSIAPKSGSLFRMKEIRQTYHYQSIPVDMIKGAITLFLNEIVNMVLREESQEDQPLFDFFITSLQSFDKMSNNYASFHLYFLAKLTHFLGIQPSFTTQQRSYFDLKEGVELQNKPLHPHAIEGEELIAFKQLFAPQSTLPHNRKERNILLNIIIEYYKLHLPSFSEPKSLKVLKTLFS